MKYFREILLVIYILIILLTDIMFVPVYVVWGSEKIMIESLVYKPLWILRNSSMHINGFVPRYELCLERIIFQTFIITLVFSMIFLLFYFINKSLEKQ